MWIMQIYEDEAHVVPDNEPGHVLDEDECFCEPFSEMFCGHKIVVHRDANQRQGLLPHEG